MVQPDRNGTGASLAIVDEDATNPRRRGQSAYFRRVASEESGPAQERAVLPQTSFGSAIRKHMDSEAEIEKLARMDKSEFDSVRGDMRDGFATAA